MKQVCLLIGEGDSERYFFPKILERKSFSLLTKKQGALTIYNKENIFWFFPFPPNLNYYNNGKERLRSSSTYKLATTFINNNKHLFNGEDYEINLIVVFDTDGASEETRREPINQAIDESGVNLRAKILCPVYLEIESWYFAGLNVDYPYFINQDSSLEKLLNSTTSVKHSKERFNSFIDLNKMIGAKDLAQSVAEYFDEEKAKKHSRSFKDFDKFITEHNFY